MSYAMSSFLERPFRSRVTRPSADHSPPLRGLQAQPSVRSFPWSNMACAPMAPASFPVTEAAAWSERGE
jgi:hypothetical protein